MTERHGVVASPLGLATGLHPGGVAANRQAQRNRRVLGLAAAPRLLSNQLAPVQLVDDFGDKASQVILRQAFVHQRW